MYASIGRILDAYQTGGNMPTYTIIGVNDDKKYCMCCGKQNLKRVVWIRNDDTQEVKHFGTTCALDPSKGFGLERDIKAAINKANEAIKQATIATHKKYREMGGTYAQIDGTMKPTNSQLWEQAK